MKKKSGMEKTVKLIYHISLFLSFAGAIAIYFATKLPISALSFFAGGLIGSAGYRFQVKFIDRALGKEKSNAKTNVIKRFIAIVFILCAMIIFSWLDPAKFILGLLTPGTAAVVGSVIYLFFFHREDAEKAEKTMKIK